MNENKEQEYSKLLHNYQYTVFAVIRPWDCKLNEDTYFYCQWTFAYVVASCLVR